MAMPHMLAPAPVVFSYMTYKYQVCQTCGHPPSDHADAHSSRELKPSEEEPVTSRNIVQLPSAEPLIALDTSIIRREATIASFFVQFQDVRVVHVRGTSASGKSTLSLILHDHVHYTRPDIEVFWKVWNRTDKIDWSKWRYREKAVLIIDEAQASYEDADFWASLVKPVADTRSGPMIALFGSYGSPSQGPGFGITPMHFTIEQRMSIRPLTSNNMQLSIFFTQQEFEDVIRLIKNQSGVRGQPFNLSTGCVEHLWLYSNGHPGGIIALLNLLMNATGLRKHRKDATEIPLEDLKEILNDELNLFRSLKSTGFGRSFPPRARIQNEDRLARFFLSVLLTDYSKENPKNNEFLRSCYHNGWLQAELTSTNENEDDEIVYMFPSRIHKGYLESILRAQSPPFPLHKYPTVEKFCFSVIRAFKSSSLVFGLGGLGTGAIQRL